MRESEVFIVLEHKTEGGESSMNAKSGESNAILVDVLNQNPVI